MSSNGERMTKDFPVMDCDGHIFEPQEIWTEYVEPEFQSAVREGMWKEDSPDGGWTIWLNGKLHREVKGPMAFFGAILVPGMDKNKLSRMNMGVDQFPVARGAYDPQARLKDLDLMGIDQVMLLPTYCGMTFTCIEDPKAALGLARAYNNWIADYCKAEPTRLFPAGIIPQHDNDDTISEVRRLAELGFKCVIIRPNVIDGRYPAGPLFDPVWEAIQETGLVAGIHPFPATPRHPADCTAWFIDRISEASGLRTGIVSETLCFAHDAQAFLMMAFHNDLWTKFPRLKLAVLESNASWLPYILDKANGRVKLWTATRGTEVKARPSEIFMKRSWIAFESDEETVFETWKRYADIGVWASDYPHFDAEDAWEAIEHMNKWGVPKDVQAKMLGTNAYEMYGIEPKLIVTERLPLPDVPLPV
ncbi:MAG: amidohydrolase family protein [Actinomycetota bacterium]